MPETKPTAPVPKAAAPKTMLVVATKPGFYVSRGYAKGQKFSLREREGVSIKGGKRKKITLSCEAQFSEKWMKKIAK